MRTPLAAAMALALTVALQATACLSPAEQLGIGTECGSDATCGDGRTCLTGGGGYCTVEGCAGDDDCPFGSACVMRDDGVPSCFLLCGSDQDCDDVRLDKREPADDDADPSSEESAPVPQPTCTADLAFVDEHDDDVEACLPPS